MKHSGMKWGTTFSTKYCRQLGLDWKETFKQIAGEFAFSVVRICAYWDVIEPVAGKIKFDWLDWLLERTEQAGLNAVLALGRKVPRWPEFHEPEWALAKDARFLHESLLTFLRKAVERYRDKSVIKMWQIENEPFYDFGETDSPITENRFREELDLVRDLDARGILVTDSGEWGDWAKVAEYGDVIGVNVYTVTYDKKTKKYNYNSFAPDYYEEKRKGITKPVIVAELQAEPWGPKDNAGELAKPEWSKSMTPDRLEMNVNLARNAGFDEILLWGSEWWAYLNEQGDPSMVAAAKALME